MTVSHDLDVSAAKATTATEGPNGAVDASQPPALLHRSLTARPYKVINAEGIYLTLDDGRRIIDACGGAAVACIGHGNEEVLTAVVEQMRQVSYVHSLTYTTDSAEQLAHILLDGNPFGLEKAYFVGSGSEAIDAALKLARQYFFELGMHDRTHYVSRRQGYHGTTVGAMTVSSNLPRKKPYAPLQLGNVSWVSPAYAYQYAHRDETEEQFATRLVEELDAHIQAIGPEKVIAFIAEPLVGATSGCTPAPKGYFAGVRRVCDKYGVLLILDEVMCGMGRTGTMFAFEQEGIVPDIMTMGKGLGGGYSAIAGVLVHKKVIDALRHGTSSFNHGHTYQAHPVACASTLAVQRIMRREKLVENCAQMGKVLYSLLRQELGGRKYVGDIRGRGLFWALEFVQNKETRASFDAAVGFGVRFQTMVFDLGIAVYPGAGTVDGTKGDHAIISPPYNVTEEQLRTIVDGLKAAYLELEREIDEPGNVGGTLAK